MKLSRKKAKIAQDLLGQWVSEGVISTPEAERLNRSYEVVPFDWKRLARYSFWIAVISVIISISSLLADEALVAFLLSLFNAPPMARCIFFGLLAWGLFFLGIFKRRKRPERIFTVESIFFLGVVATGAAVAFLGESLASESGHFSLLILVATLVYAVLGVFLDSRLIWVFALLSFGGWLGAETGYASGWGAYYLGMNYPMRFVLLGGVLLVAALEFKRRPRVAAFYASTRSMGLLYLFISLWIMSIFGNYGDMDQWERIRQYELFHWSIIFAGASLGAIYIGLRYDEGAFRGFGLVFLFINLYTRFFEYFWDSVHKAVFFAVMAASFWYIGSRAEAIWAMSFMKKEEK
ncbi:MAG: DUF2157 domain-containing protein [Desulfobacterium sp.]|nr:DUF2157 domain-containing protein [Desulfobacterium sp.]